MKNEEIKIEYKEPKIEMQTQPDFRDLSGMIPTVTTFPTETPRKLSECMKFYDSTTAYYFCGYAGNSWKRVIML